MANVEAPFFMAELSKLKYAITLSTSSPLGEKGGVVVGGDREEENTMSVCIGLLILTITLTVGLLKLSVTTVTGLVVSTVLHIKGAVFF